MRILDQNLLQHMIDDSNENYFLGFMWNPLSWVMEMAAIMAIALAIGSGKPPDWQDFVGIVVLLVINSTISFIEENNADNVAAVLQLLWLAWLKKRRCSESQSGKIVFVLPFFERILSFCVPLLTVMLPTLSGLSLALERRCLCRRR
ncbi:hypothetical protein ZIOFF_015527 [Zingiber officinale]|uniref:Uncharacterized protein n=1 Tax=Zingiber officinale TaxID=94328 RepID=A0A8J5HF24_ZINOF|nr:hypothetical protein ZIOFF_015527 [Zingiber officinale]